MVTGFSLRRALLVATAALVAAGASVAHATHRPALAQESASGTAWSSFGPRETQGFAGKFNAFAYVQTNPNVMYVAGGWGNTPRESPSQAGIYRTTDGGKHWRAVDGGLLNPDGTISSVVNGLWLDQTNPSIVLAATEFGGTFRTKDGGNSWTNVDPSESTQFSQVGTTVYLASLRGVLRSTDDGATWKVSLPAASGATTVVTAGGATYAGTGGGQVFRLHGSGWVALGRPGSGAIHNLAVDPFNSLVVYANVDDERAWNQNLFGSVDGGRKWKRIACNCSVGAQAIAFSIATPNRMYLGDDGGGSIFYFTADGNPHPTISRGSSTLGVDMRYIFPVPGTGSTDACYFVSDQGLLYTPACTSGRAAALSNGVPNFLAYDATVSPGTGTVVALQDYGAVSGNGRDKDIRDVPGSGEGGETTIDPFDPMDCYFAHPDYGLYRSTDGCTTFQSASGSGIESLTFTPPSVGKLFAVTNADDRQAAISVSSDGGATWSPTGWKFRSPYQVVVSPSDPNTIVVATGKTLDAPHLFVSHDGGTTWQRSTGLPRTPALPATSIYFPTHRFYATFEPNVTGVILLADHDPATDDILIYRSSDNGQSFSYQSTLIQPTPPRPWPNLLLPNAGERPAPEIFYYATRFYGNRLAFNAQAPSQETPDVVLTTRFGAFLSSDVGTTWTRIDTAAIPHHFIGVSWIDGYVYLASFGEGVIKSSSPLQ